MRDMRPADDPELLNLTNYFQLNAELSVLVVLFINTTSSLNFYQRL